MTSSLGDQAAKPLLFESPITEVRDIPLSNLYAARSKIFGGGKTWHEVRAYARIFPFGSGRLTVDVMSKRTPNKISIPYPYHCYMPKVGMLCAMKRYKHKLSESFALGHELFALDWEIAVICHFIEGRSFVFLIPRAEWLEAGRCGAQNYELQVFIEMKDSRRLSADWAAKALALDEWLEDCRIENLRKENR